MPGIGPELPPHLIAKKKRRREEVGVAARGTQSDRSSGRATTPDGGEKKRRIIGPAMPPAPLDEKPDTPPSPPRKSAHEDDDSSDDDFGPAVPADNEAETTSAFDRISTNSREKQQESTQLRHDDWMMHPPEQDGLAARMDPTRRRPTKFGSGKASGPSDSSIWHETPEEKRKRLENEVLGIAEPAKSSGAGGRAERKEREETRRKIEEYNKESRGKSLYELHEGKRKREGRADEDDPSKRAFDREKDIGGTTMNYSQRKGMLSRASNFGSKFSGGGYL